MMHMDGRTGEGGGQILRSSLALSALTQTPFTIEHIRAKRSKPGLMRQHLTAVRAAAAVCGAELEGDELSSQRLRFVPHTIASGEYSFAVGTAGSAMLVLQTVLPMLLFAEGPSQLHLEGGTHNPNSPNFHFLERIVLPYLRAMGAEVELELVRPGFYPAGGGEVRVEIHPPESLAPLHIGERGELLERRATAAVSHLPDHIARRELERLRETTGWGDACFVQERWESSRGPGNVVVLELHFEGARVMFTGFGEKGRPAERVADGVVEEMRRFLASGVSVGEYLADQLLLLMALAGGGSFTTIAPSLHSETHAWVIETFLEMGVTFEEIGRDAWQVTVEPS